MQFVGTFWALVPPIIAITLALITKEAYSSLFIGVVIGALFACDFAPVATIDMIVNDGIIAAIADNAGIFLFLVLLGIIVALVNLAGGSAAFGRWAEKNIHTRVGAQLATFILGILIFIDDYFNCLTVGSVMRPVTDRHQISRPKLAYLIDATAAPVCMIAPISSWAAAVSSTAEDLDTGISGIQLFIRAIPYNFYSLLTFVFIITLTLLKFDYGPMRGFEERARNTGDLSAAPGSTEENANPKGRVIDLVIPVIMLIILCTIGMLYVGGFFGADTSGCTDYAGDFIGAFGNTDAFVGLPWGGIIALVLTVIYLVARRVVGFREAMGCIPKGFQAMISPIIILTLAVSLKTTLNALGAADYVHDLMYAASERPLQYAARRHLPRRVRAGLCLRHVLGHVRHPDPHCHSHLPQRQRAALHRYFRLLRGRRVRRPLLPHLRHDHHVLRRCAGGACQPRRHAAALCHHGRVPELCVLCARGLYPELDRLPRHRRRADGRHALRHSQCRGTEGTLQGLTCSPLSFLS